MNQRTAKLIFTILMLASIIASISQTSLTTALPMIMTDLKVDSATGQWLTSGYTLVMGIMIPATAYFMERFSTRQLFISALSLFTLGSLVAWLGPNFIILLIGRVLQAMGTGIFLPLTQIAIMTIFPVERQGAMMGIYGLAATAAPVLAPTLTTGLLIDQYGWRSIFGIISILSLLTLLVGIKFLRNFVEGQANRFDSLSFILSGLGFSGLLIGLGNFGTVNLIWVIGPILVGIISLIWFTIRQLKATDPFLNLRVFQNQRFTLAVLISMLLYAAMMAGSTIYPIYIQSVLHQSAAISGLVMLPGSLLMALLNPVTGRIYDRYGIKWLLVFGSLAVLVSAIGSAYFKTATSLLIVGGCFALRLIGVACIMMPVVAWAMQGTSVAEKANQTAALTSLRTISGSFGVAVFTAMLTYVTDLTSPHLIASIHGIDLTFMGMAVIATVQLLIAIFGLHLAK